MSNKYITLADRDTGEPEPLEHGIYQNPGFFAVLNNHADLDIDDLIVVHDTDGLLSITVATTDPLVKPPYEHPHVDNLNAGKEIRLTTYEAVMLVQALGSWLTGESLNVPADDWKIDVEAIIARIPGDTP